MLVWGRYGKVVISLSFFMGFEHAIYETKGYFFLYCIV